MPLFLVDLALNYRMKESERLKGSVLKPTEIDKISKLLNFTKIFVRLRPNKERRRKITPFKLKASRVGFLTLGTTKP